MILLQACDKKAPVVKIDNHQLLAKALAKNDMTSVNALMPQLRLTEDTQNIIGLYQNMNEVTALVLSPRVDYLQEFHGQMQSPHRDVYQQIGQWAYIKQIYQQEISPPVRILQRDRLYLAPSNIDFSKCSINTSEQSDQCAVQLRKKMGLFMDDLQVQEQLKKMASKDPCVNLSNLLKGEEIAHRCLKKSKGQLAIELISKPRFSYEQWLQLITTNNNEK